MKAGEEDRRGKEESEEGETNKNNYKCAPNILIGFGHIFVVVLFLSFSSMVQQVFHQA